MNGLHGRSIRVLGKRTTYGKTLRSQKKRVSKKYAPWKTEHCGRLTSKSKRFASLALPWAVAIYIYVQTGSALRWLCHSSMHQVYMCSTIGSPKIDDAQSSCSYRWASQMSRVEDKGKNYKCCETATWPALCPHPHRTIYGVNYQRVLWGPGIVSWRLWLDIFRTTLSNFTFRSIWLIGGFTNDIDTMSIRVKYLSQHLLSPMRDTLDCSK